MADQTCHTCAYRRADHCLRFKSTGMAIHDARDVEGSPCWWEGKYWQAGKQVTELVAKAGKRARGP